MHFRGTGDIRTIVSEEESVHGHVESLPTFNSKDTLGGVLKKAANSHIFLPVRPTHLYLSYGSTFIIIKLIAILAL